MTEIADFHITALNDAESSENRIHSDEIANKYGFNGALVSGVNVFGYLCQALIGKFGAPWLSAGILDVVFLKPAYQDDLLTVRPVLLESSKSHHYTTSILNRDQTVLAKLESWLPEKLPAVSSLATKIGAEVKQEREEIHWDLITLQQAAPPTIWQPTVAENLERVEAQRDKTAIYQGAEGLIHPYYLLDVCNKALMRMFILPAWLHVGSKLIIRKPILVGQKIEIRSVPIDKWERKGHQFIKLYIAMWVAGDVVMEVEHTAIFRLAS